MTITPLPPNQAQNPALGLQHDLALADAEMHAAARSSTLAESRRHAEAAVNILVGTYGRWYGDQDGDGQVLDPSDRRGVLPGEKIPESADRDNFVWPTGWAILAYDSDRPGAKQAVQIILGQVDLWHNNPKAGYDQIARAISGTSVSTDQIAKLSGSAIRALAYARLVLTQTSSLADAQAYAQRGALETSAALDAAKQISP